MQCGYHDPDQGMETCKDWDVKPFRNFFQKWASTELGLVQFFFVPVFSMQFAE